MQNIVYLGRSPLLVSEEEYHSQMEKQKIHYYYRVIEWQLDKVKDRMGDRCDNNNNLDDYYRAVRLSVTVIRNAACWAYIRAWIFSVPSTCIPVE